MKSVEIKTEEEYNRALKRVEEIFDSIEFENELKELVILVEKYEEENFNIDANITEEDINQYNKEIRGKT